MRMKPEDFPPAARKAIEAQLAKEDERRMAKVLAAAAPLAKPKGQPNHTELEALAVLNIENATFEGRTFSVLGGTHAYTPDWWTGKTAVEVKGEWIHKEASRIRFDAARAEYPDVTWVWARKRTTGKKGPRWEVEIYHARAW